VRYRIGVVVGCSDNQKARRFTLAGLSDFHLPHVSDERTGTEYREREPERVDLSDRQIPKQRAACAIDIVLIHHSNPHEHPSYQHNPGEINHEMCTKDCISEVDE
jgi:hypothetical protein